MAATTMPRMKQLPRPVHSSGDPGGLPLVALYVFAQVHFQCHSPTKSALTVLANSQNEGLSSKSLQQHIAFFGRDAALGDHAQDGLAFLFNIR